MHRVLLLAFLLMAVIATGCSGPRHCGPACCMPPCYYLPPSAVPSCPPPQRKYSEEQWQYLDREGQPRQMGDSALRDHLGLTPASQPSPTSSP